MSNAFDGGAQTLSGSLNLYFQGPFTLTEGDRCLFDCVLRDEPCVYLWTIRNDDGRYFIHYVGETDKFAARQRQHLIGILGLDSGIFDIAAARRAELKRTWPGLWRDKAPGCMSRALSHYATATTAVLEYVGAMDIFAAVVQGDAQLRKNIEGALGYNLRRNHPNAKALYPDDNRVGVAVVKRHLRLQIAADAAIAGLDELLEI